MSRAGWQWSPLRREPGEDFQRSDRGLGSCAMVAEIYEATRGRGWGWRVHLGTDGALGHAESAPAAQRAADTATASIAQELVADSVGALEGNEQIDAVRQILIDLMAATEQSGVDAALVAALDAFNRSVDAQGLR